MFVLEYYSLANREELHGYGPVCSEGVELSKQDFHLCELSFE